MSTACDICGNQVGNRIHTAREMMFGYRDTFEYLECASCGCLKNLQVPDDLSRYYGDKYYSVAPNTRARNRLYDAMKSRRTRAYLTGSGLFDRGLLKLYGPPGLPDWVKRAGLRQESSILEVGCGSGALLLSMRSEGFRNLTGADPFVKEDIHYGKELRILKAEISEIKGVYDVIVLEHAFEHIPEPRATFQRLCSLLSADGVLIIAIPLVGYAWSHYGVNWIQLDAPRHLYLHTERSIRILAKDMKVLDVVYDSGAVQFWGSEQYAKDIPLLDERSYRTNPARSGFSAETIAEFQRRAVQLNEKRMGDQATFYFRK